MMPNEYQQLALRTDSTSTDQLYQIKTSTKARLLNGLMGLNGEAGEAIDILKKYLFQGHELDREHLAKELGDVCWYIALTADALEYSLEEIFEMNIDKLRTRYPDGFEAERSVHRKDGDV